MYLLCLRPWMQWSMWDAGGGPCTCCLTGNTTWQPSNKPRAAQGYRSRSRCLTTSMGVSSTKHVAGMNTLDDNRCTTQQTTAPGMACRFAGLANTTKCTCMTTHPNWHPSLLPALIKAKPPALHAPAPARLPQQHRLSTPRPNCTWLRTIHPTLTNTSCCLHLLGLG